VLTAAFGRGAPNPGTSLLPVVAAARADAVRAGGSWAAAAGGGADEGEGAGVGASLRVPTATVAPGVACAVLLPHAVAAGATGALLAGLLAADGGPPLALSALQTFELDLTTAAEFADVYRHVLPDAEFADFVAELAGGVAVAVEIVGADAVARLRRAAGPRDVDTAQRIRPASLRARFGVAGAKIAVQVTDLPEDGETESAYFFQVLQ
jgi:nucleoside-diphosphate kinase